MIVLVHVVVALGGLFFSGYAYVSPSLVRVRVAYGLVIITFISGTYLVISSHSPMLQACMMGLVYIGACLFGIVAAKNKINAKAEHKNRPD